MPDATGIKLVNVIRHRGDPQTAQTLTGHNVKRTEHLFVRGDHWNVFVKCAPYDDHFIYANDFKDAQFQPAYLCTCGAAAVIVPPDPRSGLFVCLVHAQTGQHATGGTRWV